MLMTIRFQDGRTVKAVLLAAGPDRMRIVTKSQRDATELRKVDTRWVTEGGHEIEIEAPLAGTDVSASVPNCGLGPQRRAALRVYGRPRFLRCRISDASVRRM
jgi:hypothetical protein